MSRTAVRLNPQDATDKWGKRLKAAVPEIQAGIARVTEAPAMKAIASKEKMRTNLIKSLDDGVWENRLGKVTLQEWKEKTSKKVGERLAGGTDAAMGKRREFDTWLVGRLNAILPEIAAMPDLTIEDSIARTTAMMRHMGAQKYKAQ